MSLSSWNVKNYNVKTLRKSVPKSVSLGYFYSMADTVLMEFGKDAIYNYHEDVSNGVHGAETGFIASIPIT